MNRQSSAVQREGFLYRLGWRLQYALLQVYGPAQLGSGNDPRNQMLRDREGHRRGLPPGVGLDPTPSGKTRRTEQLPP